MIASTADTKIGFREVEPALPASRAYDDLFFKRSRDDRNVLEIEQLRRTTLNII
jgi:hypothetical protein